MAARGEPQVRCGSPFTSRSRLQFDTRPQHFARGNGLTIGRGWRALRVSKRKCQGLYSLAEGSPVRARGTSSGRGSQKLTSLAVASGFRRSSHWNLDDLTPDGGRRSGIKRIEITRVGQGLAAHIWHFCPAGECDYGIHKLEISGTAPVYDFTLGDRRYMGSLNLYASGVVISSIDVFEPGTSNRWHHNRVFAKSTLSEKGQSAFIRYFDAPSPKAFVTAPGGAWSFRFGKSSVEDAAQDALQGCQERGFPGCRVILLNNDAAE
jgi:hypothetical protein